MVHGEEEAVKAQDAARALFSSGSAENMPEAEITEADFREGKVDILQLLVSTGLAASRSEARRTVQQGGVTVNGEKVADPFVSYEPSVFAEEFILKKGKKKFCKVIMK
jgi:tyrosyl-tRNA synthetase